MESFEYSGKGYSILLVHFGPWPCTITNGLNDKYYVCFTTMRGMGDTSSLLCLVILNQREIPEPGHGGCPPLPGMSFSNKGGSSIE